MAINSGCLTETQSFQLHTVNPGLVYVPVVMAHVKKHKPKGNRCGQSGYLVQTAVHIYAGEVVVRECESKHHHKEYELSRVVCTMTMTTAR